MSASTSRITSLAAMGITITRQSEAWSQSGSHYDTYTFTRNGTEWRHKVQRVSRAAKIRLTHGETLQRAITAFETHHGTVITHPPKRVDGVLPTVRR